MTIYDGVDTSGRIRPWDLLPGDAVDLRDTTVVVVTAHPSDTATYTGSTILRLAAAGARVVVVATAPSLSDHVHMSELLGVHRLVPLGLDTDQPVDAAHAEIAARLVAGICLSETADALIHYDRDGIDGDPDRVTAHRIGAAAARIARVTSYEATASTPETTTSVAADVITMTGKRQSMLAQATASVIASVHSPQFADTYGLEGFARKGSPGVLERLAATA